MIYANLAAAYARAGKIRTRRTPRSPKRAASIPKLTVKWMIETFGQSTGRVRRASAKRGCRKEASKAAAGGQRVRCSSLVDWPVYLAGARGAL